MEKRKAKNYTLKIINVPKIGTFFCKIDLQESALVSKNYVNRIGHRCAKNWQIFLQKRSLHLSELTVQKVLEILHV